MNSGPGGPFAGTTACLSGMARWTTRTEIFRCLADALLHCVPGQAIEPLRAFEAHARRHFAQEDAWMRSTGFPPGDADEHAKVVQDVVEVMAWRRAGAGPRETSGRLAPGAHGIYGLGARRLDRQAHPWRRTARPASQCGQRGKHWRRPLMPNPATTCSLLTTTAASFRVRIADTGEEFVCAADTSLLEASELLGAHQVQRRLRHLPRADRAWPGAHRQDEQGARRRCRPSARSGARLQGLSAERLDRRARASTCEEREGDRQPRNCTDPSDQPVIRPGHVQLRVQDLTEPGPQVSAWSKRVAMPASASTSRPGTSGTTTASSCAGRRIPAWTHSPSAALARPSGTRPGPCRRRLRARRCR